MMGGMIALAICPPGIGRPHALCMVVLFAAYSTASRQWMLFSGATLVLMYTNRANPLIGLSASALSVELDKIFAWAAGPTPAPYASMSALLAIRSLSRSAWFTLRFTSIWVAFCLAFGSVAGFQFGLSTRTSVLFSV